MPKISIIIPVYNTEKYISECLDSIIMQSFSDWECILVNDGSTDNSRTICEKYAIKDKRFKVFNKENGGVSTARNAGLEKSTGEWITFVDSDDIIAPTFIEGLYAPIAQGEQIDFVHGGCTNYKEGRPTSINQEYEYFIGENKEILFNQARGLTVSKLFKSDIIRSWQGNQPLIFDIEMKIAEDMAFTLDYIINIHKFAFVPEKGYFYRLDNMSSATKSLKLPNYKYEKAAFDHLYASTERYISANGLSDEQSIYRRTQRAVGLLAFIESLYYNSLTKKDRLKMIDAYLPIIEKLYKYIPEIHNGRKLKQYLTKENLWKLDIQLSYISFVTRVKYYVKTVILKSNNK